MASEELTDGVCTYFIQNIRTGTVLTLNGGSPVDGTNVEGTAKRELSDVWVPAQLWILTKTDSNTYAVQNGNSRTYLAVTDGYPGGGMPVIGSRPTGVDTDRWTFVRNAKKTAYIITNVMADMSIDLYRGGTADGTAVYGSRTYADKEDQLWQLVRI
ncbi:ricin B-like lectin [Irpex lacteus]|nr:ricin B-like lectin [Irpex lacteus]